MVKSIITRAPHHRDHHSKNKEQATNKPWEQLDHKKMGKNTSSKQRLQKHFPERSWHISSESKKGPKI